MNYFIDLRADAAGGNPVLSVEDVVVRSDMQSNPNPANPLMPALIQAVQGRDVLLGTHGFNVNRASGITNLSHWTEWLQLGPNSTFVGVLWPGDSRWVPVLDYPIEGNEAIKSGQLLGQFITQNLSGARTISFASHSLGARVVLEAVRALSASSIRLGSVTLMAAAIDDTCLCAEYADAAKKVKRVSVLASHCDDVLKWAFPLGNPISGILTRGSPYWNGALGREGPSPSGQPENLDQTPILPDSWNFGHHSYINCAGPAVGPPGESTIFSPLPLVVPRDGAATPTNALNWQQAWAAGFVSGRFH